MTQQSGNRQRAGVDRRTIPAGAIQDMVAARDGWPRRRIRLAPTGGEGAGGAARRGTLLFLGGRADHYEKYLESLMHWADAGWAVHSIDWRGQGGSGRNAPESNVGHVDRYARWVDDLSDDWAALCAQGASPRVIVAHSMGGHLTLRALVERRIAPAAVVLLSPMLGFARRLPIAFGRAMAGAMERWRGADAPAWTIPADGERGIVPARAAALTGDAARYADEGWWQEQRPELALGPGSWRWVSEAYASFAAMEAKGALEGVTTPVLLLGAEADALVSAQAIRRAGVRLPGAETHLYPPPAAHELLRETDAVRDDAMRRIAAFLDAHAPPMVAP